MLRHDPDVYLRGSYVVLDFEVCVNDGQYGSAQDPRNQLHLACWKRSGHSGGHVEHKFGNELEQNELVSLLSDPANKPDFIVAHNGAYELAWLRRLGVDIEDIVLFDTLLAEYVLCGNRASPDDKTGLAPIPISLDACCRRRGMIQKDAIVDIWMKNGIPVSDMPSAWLLGRCRLDVRSTETLFISQREALRQSNRLPVLYTRCLLTPVLVDVESQGMCLDPKRVQEKHTETSKLLQEKEAELQQLTGGINWKSSKQVGTYLYECLGFAELKDRRGEPKRTDTGLRLTDAKTLLALKAETPEQKAFINLRGAASKLASALSKNLDYFKHACDNTGGIFHARFNQAITATHRLSSSGNASDAGSVQFQNLPRAFKPLFCARKPEWLVMEIDGSGLEFRVAAFLGDDKQAREDLNNPGWDPHLTTASYMYGIPYDKLYADWRAGDKKADAMRTAAKSETFKPLYGGNKGTKAQERWYAGFRERYSDLARVQSGWVASVLYGKRLITPWGLRYYWPNAKVNNQGYCNVTASVYNYPIQALATAEIIPIALRYFWDATAELRLSGLMRIVNTVHDSVVVELDPVCVEEVKRKALQSFGADVYSYLKTVYGMDFDITLGAGIKLGKHWGEGIEESYNMPPAGGIVRIK
jgi:DNA polymerase I-like protein with 3'-5' exonuclease and polymerase domains